MSPSGGSADRRSVIHGYWSIDLEILHTTAADLVPVSAQHLRHVLAELEADGDA